MNTGPVNHLLESAASNQSILSVNPSFNQPTLSQSFLQSSINSFTQSIPQSILPSIDVSQLTTTFKHSEIPQPINPSIDVQSPPIPFKLINQ
jgi:hypothetical protein